LQLAQAYLAHEKYTDEARAHIDELEKELDSLKAAPATAVVSASTPGRSERPNSGAGFDFDEVEKDEERRRKKRWWGLGVV
jgi:predicted secreted Zn-dependent protease